MVEVLITFDTTGSMRPCLAQVRRNVASLLKILFAKVPNIRLAVLAHGDYGDSWVTKSIDLTTNVASLVKFVEEVQPCGIGNCDYEECYEFVLREAHTKFSWTPGAEHAVVMIGDADPHAVGDARNIYNIDWRVEAGEIKKRNFHFYAVQAMGNPRTRDAFWKPLARLTSGTHLELDQFSDTENFLLAICQHVNGGTDQVRTFCDELRARGNINRAEARMFSALTGTTVSASTSSLGAAGLTPVPPSRFQALVVDSDISIKDFALEQGLAFKTGRGFYELTKPESISDKKEIVLQEVATNDMFTGDEAKAYLGGNVGTAAKVQPPTDGKYRVFVQSTSVNRKLISGSRFLYEISND